VKVISAQRAIRLTLGQGLKLFSLAIVALGIETILCAWINGDSPGGPYLVIHVLPWLPALPWLAYPFGLIFLFSGAGLLFPRVAKPSGIVLAGLLSCCALIIELPKYAIDLGNLSLRTTVLEPLSLASIALLLPRTRPLPNWLLGLARFLLCLALFVFGIDHFLGIAFIPRLIPVWIPLRTFWVVFTGIVFVAAGLSIFLKALQFWGMVALGSMFAVWVLVLHLPNCLGLNGIPGAPQNPNQWQSLFVAIALWGGSWALALHSPPRAGVEEDGQ